MKNLEEWGEGVSNAYHNYYDFSSKQFTQRVYRYAFTGNEKVEYLSAYHCMVTSVPMQGVFGTDGVKNVMLSNAEMTHKWASSGALSIQFGTLLDTIESHGFDSVEKWKAYLAERYASDNPLIVVYSLAEPIVTTITDDSYTPPKFIRTEDGGTITFENEDKEAVPSSVKYLIDLGEIV